MTCSPLDDIETDKLGTVSPDQNRSPPRRGMVPGFAAGEKGEFASKGNGSQFFPEKAKQFSQSRGLKVQRSQFTQIGDLEGPVFSGANPTKPEARDPQDRVKVSSSYPRNAELAIKQANRMPDVSYLKVSILQALGSLPQAPIHHGEIWAPFVLGALDPPAKSLAFCWLKGSIRGIQKVKV